MEAKRFFKKFFLITGPFLSLAVLEIFVLPIDFFSSRCWEALIVFESTDLLPGPFYPNQRLERLDQGDLGAHTRYTVKKHVVWQTDPYGFRSEEQAPEAPDVAIVGDSFVVGSGLTQDATLASVLHRLTGKRVYPYAPMGLTDFLSDPRFDGVPIPVVIFAVAEKSYANGLNLPFHDMSEMRKKKTNDWRSTWAIRWDRFRKASMLHYVQNRVQDFLVASWNFIALPAKDDLPFYSQFAADRSMLFERNNLVADRMSEESVRKFAETLKTYQEIMQQKGSRLLFLPIPNKETVYYRSVPMPPPDSLERLIRATRTIGIPTIDTLSAFRSGAFAHSKLYQEDDTHWNELGVQLAAELVIHELSPTIRAVEK